MKKYDKDKLEIRKYAFKEIIELLRLINIYLYLILYSWKRLNIIFNKMSKIKIKIKMPIFNKFLISYNRQECNKKYIFLKFKTYIMKAYMTLGRKISNKDYDQHLFNIIIQN